jgi:fatty-acyl-CoA synthase
MRMASSMSQLLADNVADHGDEVAFIDGERAVTYREFDVMVSATAAWLTAQGILPGDRVAVWLVNRIEWLALYFGLGRIGAALMTVNTRYRAHELEYILERSQARLLVLQLHFRSIDFPAVLRDVRHGAACSLLRIAVADSEGLPLPPKILGKEAVRFDLRGLTVPAARRAAGPADADPESTSILFTTSGTTSGPKLVIHTQKTVTLHSQRVAASYGFRDPQVRLLATLPFCGVYGFNAAMAAFAAARPVVIMDGFDADAAVAMIDRHQITHLFGSDEMYQRILERAVGDHPFPSLRVAGFAAFHPGAGDVAKAAWARHFPMLGLYGSSEVQALFALQRSTRPLDERVEGGGAPASAEAVVRIRDLDSGELLPPNRSGAIEIFADTNFAGYLNNPQAYQAAVDQDGFFRTGDLGFLRDDGSFVYQARQGDAMRLGGFLVSPVEIEDVLKAQPGVADVQVIAIEIGAKMRPIAFAIALPGVRLEEASLLAAAAQRLAAFKVPAHVWMVESFPVTQSPNGTKIQRGRLREMALEKQAALRCGP